jgi:hypothetical protein
VSGGWQNEPFLFKMAVNMTTWRNLSFCSVFMLRASEHNLKLLLLLATNTKSAVYTVNAEAEVNKCLQMSLIVLPIIILNIIFCILKIFAPCEEFHIYINPQFITE